MVPKTSQVTPQPIAMMATPAATQYQVLDGALCRSSRSVAFSLSDLSHSVQTGRGALLS